MKKEGTDHGKHYWENKSEDGWRLSIRFGKVEATADCNERILWKMLASMNELKSVGRDEISGHRKIVFKRFLVKKNKEMGQ